jgi:hypothetical protein
MTTRYVDYSDILTGSSALAGLGAKDIGVGEFALFKEFHDRRLAQAWEINDWPDICRLEQRTFRPQWSAANTYNATDEVYDIPSGQYFQSLVSGNINNPPTSAGVVDQAHWAASAPKYSANPWLQNTPYALGAQVTNPNDNNYYQCIVAHTSGLTFDLTKWGLLTFFDRYISPDQLKSDGTPETPIAELMRATDKDPRMTTKLVKLPYWQSENGWQFTSLRHNYSFIWIWFRLRRPVLAGDAWDEDLFYAQGQGIYYVGTGGSIAAGVGNFYMANQPTLPLQNPETFPSAWDLVHIPYIFRSYLIAAGYADWLTADGQSSKAGQQEGLAYGYLELEADKLQRQQQQIRRFDWASGNGGVGGAPGH